jgi:hypothetical protein
MYCSQCDIEGKGSAKFCARCGRPLISREKPATQLMHCPQCGKIYGADFQFCAEDGSQLQSQENIIISSPTPPPEVKKSPVLKIVLLVFSLFFIAALSTGGYLYFSGRWMDVPVLAKWFNSPLTQRVEATEKNKQVTVAGGKNQKITVTPIDSGNNGCGSRGGCFDARYNGKPIGINFTHGKISTYLNGSHASLEDTEDILCPAPGKKLSFVNMPVEVYGRWSGKDNSGVDQFDAKEIFLSSGQKRDHTSNASDIAYMLSAKITNNGHKLRVLLNNQEVIFKDKTPKKNCNSGQFVFKEYEATSVREIKLGKKIVSQGVDQSIREYIDGPLASTQKSGDHVEVTAMNTGRAVMQLMYQGTPTSNYCNIKYFIPLDIIP